MQLRRYTSDDMPLWDAFIRASRNGTFLFERSYMDYHQDRFADHSLMYFDHHQHLLAVLPAALITGDDGTLTLSSHAGLTYGGFVLSAKARARDVIAMLTETTAYMRQNRIGRLVYKQVPHIYHTIPSEEEEHALWLAGARLEVCAISTVIDLRSGHLAPHSPNRPRGERRALRAGYTVSETDSLTELWPIVEQSLYSKYGLKPVHTQAEISLLRDRFPQHIRVFVASLGGTIHGGIVVYETSMVAHSQYSHATAQGKASGVVDLLYQHVIRYYATQRPDIRYFDFGISNEEQGHYLNASLISYKEDYGGRGAVYKTWVLEV